MAITKLPVDYVDSVTEQYKYKLTDVGNSERLVEDASEYSVAGSYFGATEINQTNAKANEVIDVDAQNGNIISKILKGDTEVPKSTSATKASKVNSAESVSFAQTADLADSVKTANTCTYAESSLSATQLKEIHTINYVNFDGTKDISISDETKLAKNSSFLLASKMDLVFSDKLCTISDSRITADSLCEVMFTPDCLDNALKAVITVDTIDGAVQIRAGRTPSDTLTASVFIRVI